MKVFRHYIGLLFWSIWLLSCTDSNLRVEQEVQPSGFQVYFTVPGSQNTRATEAEEYQVNSIDVIFFKYNSSTSTYYFDEVQNLPVVPIPNGDVKLIKYKVEFIPPATTPGLIWNMAFLVNANNEIAGKKAGWTQGTTGMKDVLQSLIVELQSGETPESKFIGNGKTGFPMYGLLENLALNDLANSDLGEIAVVRMVAKFTIINKQDPTLWSNNNKKVLTINSASLVKGSKEAFIYTDYYLPTQNPELPTVPSPPTSVTMPLVFIQENSPIQQKVTFYAFETNDTNKGQNPVSLDGSFATECTVNNKYTYINLLGSNSKRYVLPIPKVIWKNGVPSVVGNEAGDIIRNYHYKYTIEGVSEEKTIKAYVEVIDWNPRDVLVEDL